MRKNCDKFEFTIKTNHKRQSKAPGNVERKIEKPLSFLQKDMH